MQLPAEATRRLESDQVAWLTTVTDSGAPAPNPVCGRPRVSVHFNSDADGGDVVIISGTAALTHRVPPSGQAGFLDKYTDAITGGLATTVAAIDAEYDTCIRVTPARVRGV